jgi:hypothetical protein
MSISDALRTDAVKCSEMLQPFGKTIADATHLYVDHLQEFTRSQTVSRVVSELQAARGRWKICALLARPKVSARTIFPKVFLGRK